MMGIGLMFCPPIRIPYTLPRATRCKGVKDKCWNMADTVAILIDERWLGDPFINGFEKVLVRWL